MLSAKTVVFDINALALSNATVRDAMLLELERDGLDLICYSALNRKRTFSALLGMRCGDMFDEVVYMERLNKYGANDLRRIDKSYWVRDLKTYNEIIGDIGQRRARPAFSSQFSW